MLRYPENSEFRYDYIADISWTEPESYTTNDAGLEYAHNFVADSCE
jgi:hypothetical protein